MGPLGSWGKGWCQSAELRRRVEAEVRRRLETIHPNPGPGSVAGGERSAVRDEVDERGGGKEQQRELKRAGWGEGGREKR